MVSQGHLRLNAADRSYFAILKKDIHALAASANFSTVKLGEIDIVVAEMVSNLSKYAREGNVFVKLIEEQGVQGIEIICTDNGPGISDLNKMLADGSSSHNTLGHGLGSMKRLSDDFQVYTQKGWGTIILARIYNKKPAFEKKKFEFRSFIVPKPGETACGDGAYLKVSKETIKIILGDGLGHGQEAEKAVRAAIEAFRICPDESPMEILRFIHQSVRKTRGLVATVITFNIKQQTWKICGIGNILTKMISANNISKSYVAHNGILGHNIPNTMKDQEVSLDNGQLLVMCSDGIKTNSDIMKYPGILRQDLSLLLSAIFKDYARNTDDMSLVACKINL